MPIPIIIAGAAGAAALGAYLHAWFTGPEDAWKDSDVFNARMRDLHATGLVLQQALATCPAFMKDTNQVMAWRIARDGFSKFYADVGTLSWAPSDQVVAQARDYAGRFAQWAKQYDAYKCGSSVAPVTPSPSPLPIADILPTTSNWEPWLLGAGALIGVGWLLAQSYAPPSRRKRR